MTPADALLQIAQLHDIAFTLEGKCPGGEVGAYYARRNDGRRFVFKWSDDTEDMDNLSRIAHRVNRLCEKGYPAPRYLEPLQVTSGVVIFQDAVDGSWNDEVAHSLVDTVLRINDLQADGEVAGSSWTDYIRRTLTTGANGYCLHETLRSYSDQSRRLFDWVKGVGDQLAPLPGLDVVHLDFHHRNLLRVNGDLTAVVDWEGCQNGDRAFDLVTFCFGLTHANAEPRVASRLWDRAVELTTADAIRGYVAHMALRRADWTIRHHPEEFSSLMTFIDDYVKIVA